MTFTTDDLLMPDAELAIYQQHLASAGNQDPVGATIAEAVSQVEQACAQYSISGEWKKRMVRAIAVYSLWVRSAAGVGNLSEKVKGPYEEAMKDLDRIQQDKYPHLLISGQSPATAPSASPSFGTRELTHTWEDQAGL